MSQIARANHQQFPPSTVLQAECKVLFGANKAASRKASTG